MASNPRCSNGARYRRLRKHLLATEDVCVICGGHIDKSLRSPHPMSAEVEHLVPVSRGGAIYAPENCGLCHRICNQRKGNRMVVSQATNNSGIRNNMPAPIETSRQW
jgi:5-methylcytosine-specific restriction endonuclease McrA